MTRKWGKSNLLLHPVGIGCMSLDVADRESVEIIQRAIGQGFNFIDTADLYDRGLNEELVGQAIAGRRDEVVLATKVGNRWRKHQHAWDWVPSKSYILQAVERSLTRLKTDYIDLYMLHGGTMEDPFDEIIDAFESLVDQGKILTYGISSIRPAVIQYYSENARISAVMTPYNVIDRRAENEIFPSLAEKNIAIIVRGGLAQGLLNGKPPQPYLAYSKDHVAKIVQSFEHISRENDISLIRLALGFLLAQPAVASVAVGVRTKAQLDELTDFSVEELVLPDDIITQLKELVR